MTYRLKPGLVPQFNQKLMYRNYNGHIHLAVTEFTAMRFQFERRQSNTSA